MPATFLGSYRYPQGPGDDHLGFGGILARDAAADQWYVASSGKLLRPGGPRGRVVAFTPPAPVISNVLTDLPIAQFAGPFVESAPSWPTGTSLWGMHFDNGRPIYSAFYYYDNNTQRQGHYVDGQWRTVLDDHRQGFVAGWIIPVPGRWRGYLGDALVGQGCVPVISRSSYGPAAFGRLIWSETGVIPAAELLYYDSAHQRLGDYGGSDLRFNQTAMISGGVIIGDWLAFLGTIGESGYCYGHGTKNILLKGTTAPDGEKYCYDPVGPPDKGGHAETYRYQVWWYKIPDLLAAEHPWDPLPIIEKLPISFPGIVRLMGVASDGGNLVTLNQYAAENNFRVSGYPVAHVLRLTPPEPIAPPAPTLEDHERRLQILEGIVQP